MGRGSADQLLYGPGRSTRPLRPHSHHLNRALEAANRAEPFVEIIGGDVTDDGLEALATTLSAMQHLALEDGRGWPSPRESEHQPVLTQAKTFSRTASQPGSSLQDHRHRARRASGAMNNYYRSAEEALRDLRHWADLYGVDWQEACQLGEEYFETAIELFHQTESDNAFLAEHP